ncbi:MAG TPA: hypothetical protein VMI31_19185, partial [Fimbriimonadaceae bacterium]|nr:hypothetical protein [Fimbriimonadaceae bacterium]
MIFHLALESNDWTWRDFLRNWGSSLRSRVRTLPVHQLANLSELPVGVYIFTDHEIQTPSQRSLLAQVWRQLEDDGRSRLLNHPLGVSGRFELLQELYRLGINEYRAFRIDEIPRDLRFPAFIRYDNDHRGS